MNSSLNGRYLEIRDWRSLLFRLLSTLIAPLIIIAAPPAVAQDEATDETEAVYAELHERFETIRLAIFGRSPDALVMAEEAEEFVAGLPESPRQVEMLVKSIRFQVSALDELGRVDEAIERLARAEQLPLPENSTQFGGLHYARARIADSQGEFGVALEYYQKAYEVYLAAEQAESQGIVLGQIANTYLIAHQYERAIAFIRRAQEVDSGVVQSNMARHNNLGEALHAVGRYEEAIIEYGKAYELARNEKLNNMQQLVLGNLGDLELSRGNYAAAYEWVEKALVIAPAQGIDPNFINALGVRAELDRLTGRVDQAESAIKKIIEIIGMNSAEPRYFSVYETAYKLYRELGDYEQAFAHLAAFKRLDDMAKNLAADANSSILSAEFEFAQKELEIERLRTDQLESDAALGVAARRQTQIIIFGLAVLGLGVIGFAVWRYVSVQKTQRITQALNTELAAKNAALVSSNTELEKANQAKMEFLATTSHEVRTPLNAIISLTDVILKAEKFTDNDRNYLEVVNSSGRNLLHILDDILDVSKLEAGRLKINARPMDIAECVLDVAQLWRNSANEKGLDYKIDVDDVLGEYVCDERLIRQIVSNLLSNAIKFTAEGEVSLQLSAPAENGFAISVRDTGVGIAPDQQAAIFETFHQADSGNERVFGGTGLGLAICKKIAEALGGNIGVASQPDAGALFTVKIPAEKCKAGENDIAVKAVQFENDNSRESASEKELSVIRILVAEDNPANALVICAMLSGQVARIEVAENGAEAVKAIQERSFDVILMDKQMPVMDGVVATQKIRALPAPLCNIPIIGLTAGVLANSKEDCLGAGMDDYLTKPVPSAMLKAAILKAIKERRTVAA